MGEERREVVNLLIELVTKREVGEGRWEVIHVLIETRSKGEVGESGRKAVHVGVETITQNKLRKRGGEMNVSIIFGIYVEEAEGGREIRDGAA